MGNAHVSSTVSSSMAVNAGTSLTISYTKPSTVTYGGVTGQEEALITDSADRTEADGGFTRYTKITWEGDALQQDAATTFHPNSRIKIECKTTTSGTAGTFRNLGIYTVDGVPTATTLSVSETIVDNDCTAGADKVVRITQVSNIITVGDHDFRETTSLVSDERISFTVDGTTSSVNTVVKSVQYHSDVTLTNVGSSKGFIILKEEAADSLSASVGVGSGSITWQADGTRENVECSDRGLCQEDGTCKCFQGYTGDNCANQKSIAT